MYPSLTGFNTVSQKLSDVIPVLRITLRATEPSTVSDLSESASSRAVAYVGHRHAHILALSHPGSPRGFHRVSQKVRKNSNFWPFRKFTSLPIPYIYATVINRGVSAAYGKKCFIHPISNFRMCMDPSPTGFYRVVQKVSDVISVLRIMSRLPLLFSWASSSVVAYVGHRPTQILA